MSTLNGLENTYLFNQELHKTGLLLLLLLDGKGDQAQYLLSLQ